MRKNRVNVSSVLTWSAWRYPERIAVISEDKTLKYREFNTRCNRLAHALYAMGIKRGDRVGILLMNCPEFLESYFASAKLGACAVALNYRLSGEELAYILDDCSPRVLILGNEFLSVVESIRDKQDSVAYYICVGNKIMPPYIEYEGILSKHSSEEAFFPIDEDDAQLIMYTSGTTGVPKGAMITHRHLIWNSLSACIYWSITPEDITLTVAPLYHVGGLHDTTFAHIHVGGAVVLLKRFDTLGVAKAIERHSVTNLFMVPTMWGNFLNMPELQEFDFSSLRFILSGGSPMPLSIIQSLHEKITTKFYMGYGLTEAGPNVCFLDYQDALRKAGSIGKPFPHFELKLCDNGKKVLPGEVGEITLRGNSVFKGYYQKPKETKRSFRDGWFLTGDLARMDDEGYIYITDRKKDMIISGGENIYSAEVERVLNLNPKVAESAVVGVPHEKWGEAVKAYVMLKPGEKGTPEELIEFCEARLGRYKRPKYVEFLEDFPRNHFGKILKRTLRDSFKLALKH